MADEFDFEKIKEETMDKVWKTWPFIVANIPGRCFNDANPEEIFAVMEERLTTREKEIVVQKYRDGMRLDDIGQAHGVTRERIRQIIAKAGRKMTHGILNYRKRRLEAAMCESIGIEAERQARIEKSILYLNPSVRTYNCLHRAGIDTIEDLRGLTAEELMRIRNFGASCLCEVRTMLANVGLHLKGEGND